MVNLRRVPVFLGFLAHAVTDGSIYMTVAMIPVLVQTMHIGYAQAGLVWTIANLGVSIPQPLFGIVSDRTGKFGLAALGLAITAVALGLIGRLDNYYLLLLAAAVAGIGGSILHPVAAAIVAAASGTRRGMAMSFYTLGGNAGFAISPLILAPLVLQRGLGVSWVLFPIGALTAAALFLGTRNVPRPQRKKAKEDGAKVVVPLVPLSVLTAVVVLRSWVYTAGIGFFPIFLTTRGLSLEDGSRILSLLLIFGAIGSIIGGILSDYFSAKWVTLTSMVLLGIVLFATFQTEGLLSIVLLVLSGGVMLASFAVTVVMAQKLLPTQQALASGITLGLGIGIGGIGSGITGWLIDAYGMQVAMLSFVVVAFVGAITMLAYREKEWHKAHELATEPA